MIWFLVYVAVAGIVTAGRQRCVEGPLLLWQWLMALGLGWLAIPVVAMMWIGDKLGDVKF
jgi:uncharacterized membrane protein